MKSFINSIPQSDNITYWHLQNSLFPLLPFFLPAPVPGVVLIWRRSQGSRVACRSARTEGADGGSKRRPPFSLLLLQPPFTNFSKYFVMLQGVLRSEKQAVIQLVWRFCKQTGVIGFAANYYFCQSPQAGILTELFMQDVAILHTGFSN